MLSNACTLAISKCRWCPHLQVQFYGAILQLWKTTQGRLKMHRTAKSEQCGLNDIKLHCRSALLHS
jgi:hypothetical protein